MTYRSVMLGSSVELLCCVIALCILHMKSLTVIYPFRFSACKVQRLHSEYGRLLNIYDGVAVRLCSSMSIFSISAQLLKINI